MPRGSLLALFSIPLLLAACWALRLAYADFLFRSGTPQAIRRAAELAPLNPEYQARAGNLRKAVQLNPYYSSAWIDLALASESEGDWNEAERCLLAAAGVDRTFEPRWALANFYFRRDDLPQAWNWLRLAAERSYGDRTALFRLASRMTDDPRETLHKIIPRDAQMLSEWISYLIAERKPEVLAESSQLLIAVTSPAGATVILKTCEELLKAGRSGEALAVWNAMIEAKLLAYNPLNPKQGASLTNGSLQVQPAGTAFDWRLLWREGVDSRWHAESRQIRIGLSGKQQEKTDLLEQFVPVLPGEAYEFRYRYRTDGLGRENGLRWRVLDASNGDQQEQTASMIPIGDQQEQCLRFRTGKRCEMVRLQFVFERQMGTVRPEGTIVFEGAFHLSPTR